LLIMLAVNKFTFEWVKILVWTEPIESKLIGVSILRVIQKVWLGDDIESDRHIGIVSRHINWVTTCGPEITYFFNSLNKCKPSAIQQKGFYTLLVLNTALLIKHLYEL